MEKEIHKDRLISMNLHENPKAPSPKEMVDLEVMFISSLNLLVTYNHEVVEVLWKHKQWCS